MKAELRTLFGEVVCGFDVDAGERLYPNNLTPEPLWLWLEPLPDLWVEVMAIPPAKPLPPLKLVG